MHIRILTFIIIISSIAGACNKTQSPVYNDRPVVAGYLVAGMHPAISITRQLYTSSGVSVSADDLNALEVFLSDGTDTRQMVLIDTVYTDTSMYVQEGLTYTLTFMYNGKEVTATTKVPMHPTSYSISDTAIGMDKIDASSFTAGPPSFSIADPIDVSWTNDDNSYFMLLAEDTTEAPELIRDTISGDNRPAFNFRNQPSISASARLQAMSFEYFGVYRLTLFHLQPEYATLYETTGNSSQSLTTPVTNVVNGFGIFTGMTADTLYLRVFKN